MSGRGDGARNRGDIRPRAKCPTCGRSIAVTFNSRTGEAYLRAHVKKPVDRCSMSNRAVPRELVFQPAREVANGG